MNEQKFFKTPAPLSLEEIVEICGAKSPENTDLSKSICGIAPLEDATSSDLSFLDNPKYVSLASATGAGVVLCASRFAERLPDHVIPLVSAVPYKAFAQVAAILYPASLVPELAFCSPGEIAGKVHTTAKIESGATVEPGAVIGSNVEIGEGTIIASNAIISANVTIGRNCYIGPGCVIQHTVIGNNVILHPGVKSGQDGFGFAMGPGGHLKVPQIGRVIIQDSVEIGANSAIDRGANRDTMIGEGTKIDNQVQIGHNVVVGRHCIIVSQVGLSGSCTLGDFVAIGGQSGVAGHVTVGSGAQIAAVSVVKDDVPAGGRYGGCPAKPVKQWFREISALKKLAERKPQS